MGTHRRRVMNVIRQSVVTCPEDDRNPPESRFQTPVVYGFCWKAGDRCAICSLPCSWCWPVRQAREQSPLRQQIPLRRRNLHMIVVIIQERPASSGPWQSKKWQKLSSKASGRTTERHWRGFTRRRRRATPVHRTIWAWCTRGGGACGKTWFARSCGITLLLPCWMAMRGRQRWSAETIWRHKWPPCKSSRRRRRCQQSQFKKCE